MKENFSKNTPAGLFQRLVANLIDFLTLSLVALGLGIFFSEVLGKGEKLSDFFIFGVPLGILVLYILLRDSLPFLNGQSIGKKIIGIRTVELQTGSPLTGKYGKNIIRDVFQFIPFLNVIDALSIFSSTRQRLGDKLAGTHVVKV